MPTYESVPFEVSTDGRQVFHFNDVRKDFFWLDILPDIQMYLNYLAIYDGIWSAEQLGIANADKMPRRASQVNVYTTDTNSYTLTGLNLTSRYVYRVRSVGDEDRYSQWSEEKTFTFSGSTDILLPYVNNSNAPVRYYDLQGREVDSSTKGVIIVRQGDAVRKVIR